MYFLPLVLSTLLNTFVLSAPLSKRAYAATATYYGPPFEPAGPFGIGACGNDPIDRRYFVGVAANVYDGARCGQCVQLTHNGRTTVGPMADKCPGCKGAGLDISITMMNELTGSEEASINAGYIDIEWEYVPCPQGRGVVGQQNLVAEPPKSSNPSPQSNNPTPVQSQPVQPVTSETTEQPNQLKPIVNQEPSDFVIHSATGQGLIGSAPFI